MITVQYQLPLPPSTNRIWRNVVVKGKPRTLQSREYRAWLNEAAFLLRLQGVVTPDPPVRVHVVIEGGKGFHRGKDLDNLFKAPLDLLRRCEVLADDNLCNVVSLRADFVRVAGPSRCLVTVSSVGAEGGAA